MLKKRAGLNPSLCGSGLVLHQTRNWLWHGVRHEENDATRSHCCADHTCGVSSCMGKEERGNCLENTFIPDFRNGAFKVQREGAAVFALRASKVSLWQEGRWVGPVFHHNFPFPWAAQARGGGQMEAALRMDQLWIHLVSSGREAACG